MTTDNLLKPIISPTGTIGWGVKEESNGRTTIVRYTRTPLGTIPDDAPQEVKDLAAKHWTPEVIQAAKDRLAARPK